jgi:hypothetical protein
VREPGPQHACQVAPLLLLDLLQQQKLDVAVVFLSQPFVVDAPVDLARKICA